MNNFGFELPLIDCALFSIYFLISMVFSPDIGIMRECTKHTPTFLNFIPKLVEAWPILLLICFLGFGFMCGLSQRAIGSSRYNGKRSQGSPNSNSVRNWTRHSTYSVPYVSFWQWIQNRIMWHLPCEIQILYT